MSRPRIVLADDNQSVIAGIRKILEAHFDIVATVADGKALIEQTRLLEPDAVVVDISMPVLDGIQAARRILREETETRVVFLTIHGDRAIVEQARASGASGYVLKTSADEDLVKAIREALAGRKYASPPVGPWEA